MLRREEIQAAYAAFKSVNLDLTPKEMAEVWNRITGIWFIWADIIEVQDEVADLINSMRGKHGLTICKALRAKYGSKGN